MRLFGIETEYIFRRYVMWWIRLYQKTLSLDHGLFRFLAPFGQCRFQPTCSEYTYQAVERFGVFPGLRLGVKRVLKCNPFSAGGYDPVPDKDSKSCF